jgi:hypothetical protein
LRKGEVEEGRCRGRGSFKKGELRTESLRELREGDKMGREGEGAGGEKVGASLQGEMVVPNLVPKDFGFF